MACRRARDWKMATLQPHIHIRSQKSDSQSVTSQGTQIYLQYSIDLDKMLTILASRENLPRDMEVFLSKNYHDYVVNVSANAFNCWIIVYWTKYSEYEEYKGGRIGLYPEILNRLNDFQNKNRGRVRSTAFGSGKETCFLRASDGQHQWSFRWKDLPFDCEMKVQDCIQQSWWVDRRPEIEGKEPLERVQYYRLDPG